MDIEGSEKHFVLVHGCCHGAWCWYKLKTLLEVAGHKVTAVDLAAAGVHPKQLTDIRSISDYFEPLYSFFEGLEDGERVVLVSHGKGGLAAGAAMERFPYKVSVGVFASAFMLGPDYSIFDINREFSMDASFFGPDSEFTYDDQGRYTSMFFGSKFMLDLVYRLTPKEDFNLSRLLARPYPFFDDERAAEELKLSKEKYGSVKRVYIVCGQDVGTSPERANLFIKNTPPDEVYEMPDAAHMVMLAQPQELSILLQNIANKY